MRRRALSLLEVLISLFLLSVVALGVLSMTRMAFVRQKRNQHGVEATIIAQSTLNQIRTWALDPEHYLQADWSSYTGSLTSPLAEYSLSVRSLTTARALYSPCASLEEQWIASSEGARELPKALVPVEVKVAWSAKSLDSIRLVGYIGEPRREIAGYQAIVHSPSSPVLAKGDSTTYSVEVFDSAHRPFPNLLFNWNVDSDYLTILGDRDGRSCTIRRETVVNPPTPPAPPLMLVECTAQYAGANITTTPNALQLP